MLSSCNFIYFLIILLRFSGFQAQYSYGSYESIPIALLTDQNTEQMNIVFDHAIDVANEELKLSLTSTKAEVNYGDSYQSYVTLCQMMETGIAGVFGPSSRQTAVHLMSICDAMDIPHIFSYMSEYPEGFNLHPHAKDLANILQSIIQAFEWFRFIFLYESVEDLGILYELNNILPMNVTTVTVLRYDMNADGNYKPVLRRIRKSTDYRIVVVGSAETLPKFLDQAQQIGIINEEYSYIIGNFDFHALDLEEYKYGEANITSIRLFSPSSPAVKELIEKMSYDMDNFRNGSCPITVEMALTYDAVQLFASTLKNLPFKPVPQNCSQRTENARDDGSSFKNYMRTLRLENRTLTGPIYFEGIVRKGYHVDVIELQTSGIVKVGTWDEERLFKQQRILPANSQFDSIDNSLSNKTFLILLSSPNEPYASLVESYKQLEGNSQYEGFSVDLVEHLAKMLGFNYVFKNYGPNYGEFNKTTNQTTGMLYELEHGLADLAVTDLTITAERQEFIDFSIPFMNLGISILYRKPAPPPPQLFSFMDPFSQEVWWIMGISFFAVSFSFFILGRLSPAEWDNPHPCIEEPEELENQFTIGNSIWFATGALLQQGSEIGPKALSTRIVASFWWFFTLLIVASYTANLAAFLTSVKPQSVIDNVEDLADQKGGVVYGSRDKGSTRTFFATSKVETYQRMNEFMNAHPEHLTQNNQEGVKRVKDSKYYAFLMESTSIEYNTKRECQLEKVGEPLDEKCYGIAMPKNWPHRDKINEALLKLRDAGMLEKMKNKWWNEVGIGLCGSKEVTADATPLAMANFEGIFYVMLAGSICAVIYGLISWFIFVVRKARHYQVPLKDALKEELQFLIDINSYVRIIKSSSSIYSRSRQSSVSAGSRRQNT